ncbi:MAG: hypothetical protein JO317_03105, partial [Verrucomicrobiae bacterium]|nr:hypothetical protein [Verrucomicrobiae bacterium]
MKRILSLALALSLLVSGDTARLLAQATPAPSAAAEPVVLNFQNAPLETVIEYYARFTGRTAIYPSNLNARVTLQSNGELTREDAIKALENVLSVNGFAIIPQGEKFFKVVPVQAAKQEGVPFASGAAGNNDRLVTKIITLRYVDYQSAMQSLQPLVHPFGQLIPFPRTNSILVTDTAANIMQFEQMLGFLDQPLEARVQPKFYTLRHAKARDVLTQLQALISNTQTAVATPGGLPVNFRPPGAVPIPGGGPLPVAGGDELSLNEDAVVLGKTTMSADERTNQIIVLTRAVNFPFFDQLIAKLDIDTAAPVIIKTIPLRYAKADETAALLSQMIGGSTSTTAQSSRSSRVGEKPNP